MDQDLLKKLGLEPTHTFNQTSFVNKTKGRLDIDVIVYDEFDKSGVRVAEVTIHDTTERYPPFSREIYLESRVKV